MAEWDDGWDELIEGVDELYASEMADELGRDSLDPDRLRDIEWDWSVELGMLQQERDQERARRGRSGR
jgi:hypothetical protein